MSLIRHSAGQRFRPASMFRPGSLAVLGAGSPQGALVMRNLAASGFHGSVLQPSVASGCLSYPGVGPPPQPPDVAVLCDGGGAPETLMPMLAAAGVFACVVIQGAGTAPRDLRGLAEATGVRSLGPNSFGLAVPAIGLDATLGHLRPRAGRVALVSQSAGLCRTVLDWAGPSGVGFSHIVGVGTNDDVGYGLVLDWLSRDPGTGAILLDIRRLKDARLFLSAARAAARLRPVVAIRAGDWIGDRSGMTEAVLGAALHRVGVLCVDRLEDFLGAAETLTRVKPARGDSLAVVGNAIGPTRMAADAALRDGLELSGEGPVSVAASDLASAARRAGGAGAGAVLIVHAPEGDADEAVLREMAAEAATQKLPWLVCALGETTGAVRRQALGAAGLPAFAGPDAAVRAFAHLAQDRRSRAAARELPPSALLDILPDAARVTEGLARLDLASVLRAYGVIALAGSAGVLRLESADDPLFGPFLSLRSALTGNSHDRVVDLPPLNLALARAMASRSGLIRDLGVSERVAEIIVRVSALLVDRPDILALQFDPCVPAEGDVRLREVGAAAPRLALPPYPMELVGTFDAGGERLTIRPIRPEDADAHAAFFRRIPAEDVRRRFFMALREISIEQIVRMTEIDYQREMALVAVAGGGETVGVARVVRETLLNEGEFAVVVQPDFKGRGLARHLVERLIEWGRTEGMDAIVGEILAENHPMRAFAERLGFTVRPLPDDPEVVEARLSLGRGG